MLDGVASAHSPGVSHRAALMQDLFLISRNELYIAALVDGVPAGKPA